MQSTRIRLKTQLLFHIQAPKALSGTTTGGNRGRISEVLVFRLRFNYKILLSKLLNSTNTQFFSSAILVKTLRVAEPQNCWARTG